jgi:hypothetical protein
MRVRETFIYLPMPVNFILDRIYNHNVDISEEEDSGQLLDAELSKISGSSILYIILFILFWILYIYGIILSFGCQEHKLVHILASLFAAPLYSIYIAIEGCRNLNVSNIFKSNKRTYQSFGF